MPRQTRKYSGACQILTYPHTSQEQLYAELNRLGWWWNSKTQQWERNEQLATDASKLVKLRVWTGTYKVEQIADLLIEAAAESIGLRLLDKSEPYICRPPQHNDSRVYLTFIDEGEDN